MSPIDLVRWLIGLGGGMFFGLLLVSRTWSVQSGYLQAESVFDLAEMAYAVDAGRNLDLEDVDRVAIVHLDRGTVRYTIREKDGSLGGHLICGTPDADADDKPLRAVLRGNPADSDRCTTFNSESLVAYQLYGSLPLTCPGHYADSSEKAIHDALFSPALDFGRPERALMEPPQGATPQAAVCEENTPPKNCAVYSTAERTLYCGRIRDDARYRARSPEGGGVDLGLDILANDVAVSAAWFRAVAAQVNQEVRTVSDACGPATPSVFEYALIREVVTADTWKDYLQDSGAGIYDEDIRAFFGTGADPRALCMVITGTSTDLNKIAASLPIFSSVDAQDSRALSPALTGLVEGLQSEGTWARHLSGLGEWCPDAAAPGESCRTRRQIALAMADRRAPGRILQSEVRQRILGSGSFRVATMGARSLDLQVYPGLRAVAATTGAVHLEVIEPEQLHERLAECKAADTPCELRGAWNRDILKDVPSLGEHYDVVDGPANPDSPTLVALFTRVGKASAAVTSFLRTIASLDPGRFGALRTAIHSPTRSANFTGYSDHWRGFGLLPSWIAPYSQPEVPQSDNSGGALTLAYVDAEPWEPVAVALQSAATAHNITLTPIKYGLIDPLQATDAAGSVTWDVLLTAAPQYTGGISRTLAPLLLANGRANRSGGGVVVDTCELYRLARYEAGNIDPPPLWVAKGMDDATKAKCEPTGRSLFSDSSTRLRALESSVAAGEAPILPLDWAEPLTFRLKGKDAVATLEGLARDFGSTSP